MGGIPIDESEEDVIKNRISDDSLMIFWIFISDQTMPDGASAFQKTFCEASKFRQIPSTVNGLTVNGLMVNG